VQAFIVRMGILHLPMKKNLTYSITALLLTLYLGYIDEGYFNFNFLRSIGNIIVLLVYLLMFLLLQMGLDWVLNRIFPKLPETFRQASVIGLGLLIPVFVFIVLPQLR
jgi:hypothetical protein